MPWINAKPAAPGGLDHMHVSECDIGKQVEVHADVVRGLDVQRTPAKPPRKPAAGPFPSPISPARSRSAVLDNAARPRGGIEQVDRPDRKRGRRGISTKSERDAATEFVRGHRLTIANCFERRLCGGDVVAGLLRLYEKSKDDDPVRFPD
jgi:hypothetical protein